MTGPCPSCGHISRTGPLCESCGAFISENTSMPPKSVPISLFHIEPYTIDTGSFDNLLHGKVVRQFEKEFCDYVGAKYACSMSSATNAIFLSLISKSEPDDFIVLPSILPPVVANACYHAELNVSFVDNVDWVGWSYVLHTYGNGSRIIDSAQRVDRGQFSEEANDDDLMIFSFYPTKPVGSCDGGIIVSNNRAKIEWLKEASMNGTTLSGESWTREVKFRGWKMYMNSIQAQMALSNLQRLDEKKKRLAHIRNFYNHKLGLNNRSDHLYRISVPDNASFIEQMKSRGVICGKHYEPLHLMPAYGFDRDNRPCRYTKQFIESERVGKTTVSLPFHEALTVEDVCRVLRNVQELTST